MTNSVELPLEYQLKIQYLTNTIKDIDDIEKLKSMTILIIQNALTYQYLTGQMLKKEIG